MCDRCHLPPVSLYRFLPTGCTLPTLWWMAIGILRTGFQKECLHSGWMPSEPPGESGTDWHRWFTETHRCDVSNFAFCKEQFKGINIALKQKKKKSYLTETKFPGKPISSTSIFGGVKPIETFPNGKSLFGKKAREIYLTAPPFVPPTLVSFICVLKHKCNCIHREGCHFF